MSCDYLRSAPIRRLPHSLEENPIWSVLGSVISIVVAVALSLPFLLAFLLVLPACLSVKWLLFFIHYGRQGSRPETVGESVRGNDSRWLGSEWRTSVIHAVLVFEAKDGVNVEHFRRLLLKRVIPIYPRLKQRLICLPIAAGGGNCWLTDSEFSIDRHVFSGPSILTNEKELQTYVAKLVEVGLPEDKPPWQLQIFQSFGVSHDTVAVLRVHQSVADGTSLMRLLCHSFADSQVIEIPERPRFGAFAFCVNVFRACIVGPLTLLLWLFLSGDDCNVLTHRSGWTGSETVTWSASITLPKVIRIKQVTRSTVNCVLLSALAGALRRLLQGCGVKQPPNVKVVVPMDIRSQSSSSSSSSSIKTTLGNKTSSMTMPLPVAIEGCIPRLWATRKTLEALKTSADPVILYVATAALMSIGSASFARHLVNFLSNKASLQFAFLPGPTSEIFLEGQALKGIYPILPAQANLGISITTITYADQVFVSVMAEQALGPAAELLLEYLEDQIEILWKLLLNRRVPGEPENPIVFTKTRVSESPVKEIASRLNLVQKEVEHLNESQEKNKEKKLSSLKAEFSELVDELKRRQSLCETQNSDPSLKPRRRAFSCSATKKLLNLSPSLHRQEMNLPQFPSNYELLEVNERKSKEHKKAKMQSVNKSWSETQFNKTARDESPNKSSRHEGRTHSKSQNFKNSGFKDVKNRVSNKLEKSSSSKNNSKSARYKSYTRNDEYFSEVEDFDENTQSDIFLEEFKRTSLTPKSDKYKQKSKSTETSIIISCPSEERESNTETKNQTSESESETAMESQFAEVSDVIIKVSDVRHQSYLTEETGPNQLNCHLEYRNYLEAVKLEDKNQIQVPCPCYEIISQDKFDDSDESDIVGGVLI